MSVRESSEGSRLAAIEPFTRWPGLLRLALDVLGGPIIALVYQEATYAGNMWACGHNAKPTLHVGAVLCVIGALIVIADSWMVWRTVGRGVEDEHGAEETRTRFLALIGIMVGAISLAVIVAQWLAIFMFGPCMRA